MDQNASPQEPWFSWFQKVKLSNVKYKTFQGYFGFDPRIVEVLESFKQHVRSANSPNASSSKSQAVLSKRHGKNFRKKPILNENQSHGPHYQPSCLFHDSRHELLRVTRIISSAAFVPWFPGVPRRCRWVAHRMTSRLKLRRRMQAADSFPAEVLSLSLIGLKKPSK